MKVPGGPIDPKDAALLVPALSGAGRIAAERERQKKDAAHCDSCDGSGECPECGGTGRGREYLNHQDNTPTGTYADCYECKGAKKCAKCKGVGKHAWTVDHDDHHGGGELAMAAACYAAPERVLVERRTLQGAAFVDPWPWDRRWDKRYTRPVDPNLRGLMLEKRIRELEKAGALAAAEIDRLLRLLEADE